MMKLNRSIEADVADEVLSNLEFEGIDPTDAIPGLVLAIKRLADGNDQMLFDALALLESDD